MTSEPGTAGIRDTWLPAVVVQPMRGMRQAVLKACLLLACVFAMVAMQHPSQAAGIDPKKFKRVPTQYIAALADPDAHSGNGAQTWGLWPLDPGPRGIQLSAYGGLTKAGGVSPAGWKFSEKNWWLEEHGLIMEQPEFPAPAKKYVVTGGRDAVAVLTIFPPDKNGNSRWELDNGATLHDVTHLACRSAVYTPVPGAAAGSCSPAKAQQTAFPVAPGAAMPPVEGCSKQDYAVLIVIGLEVGN